MTHPDTTALVRALAGLDVDYAVPEFERCEWAGCDTTAAGTEDGWRHCAEHLTLHRSLVSSGDQLAASGPARMPTRQEVGA